MVFELITKLLKTLTVTLKNIFLQYMIAENLKRCSHAVWVKKIIFDIRLDY